jgi:hypothetical protein
MSFEESHRVSKHETWMTRWYWEQGGGTLIEEYPAVRGTRTRGPRWLDGLIILGGENERLYRAEVPLEGRDVVAVQAKARRLGMYLMGQTLFSRDLVLRQGARSVESVALCTADDDLLRPMLEEYDGCRVVVVDRQLRSVFEAAGVSE